MIKIEFKHRPFIWINVCFDQLVASQKKVKVLYIILTSFVDKQKPTLDRCFSPLPIVSPEAYTHVTWEEPIFSDNSGEEVRIRRSHVPGLFPQGIAEVTYIAYDASGNNNTCTLRINVIRKTHFQYCQTG